MSFHRILEIDGRRRREDEAGERMGETVFLSFTFSFVFVNSAVVEDWSYLVTFLYFDDGFSCSCSCSIAMCMLFFDECTENDLPILDVGQNMKKRR